MGAGRKPQPLILTGVLKTCARCGEEKDTGAFGRQRGRADGLRPECKKCNSSYGALHHRLQRSFYDTLLEQQGGVCYVCHQPETCRDTKGNIRKLAIDIDYKRGWICGLACRTCNISIEIFRKNPAMLLSFQYALERSRYDTNQPRIAA